MPIQLPDDVVAVGYKEVRPYHHEQVFQSTSAGFTGTEREFVAAGHGYEYVDLDPYTRRVLPLPENLSSHWSSRMSARLKPGMSTEEVNEVAGHAYAEWSSERSVAPIFLYRVAVPGCDVTFVTRTWAETHTLEPVGEHGTLVGKYLRGQNLLGLDNPQPEDLAFPKLVGWRVADNWYRENQVPGAIYEKVFGGNDTYVRYDMTIVQDGAGFIPVHGEVKMPGVATAEEAAAVLTEYWETLSDRHRLTCAAYERRRIPPLAAQEQERLRWASGLTAGDEVDVVYSLDPSDIKRMTVLSNDGAWLRLLPNGRRDCAENWIKACPVNGFTVPLHIKLAPPGTTLPNLDGDRRWRPFEITEDGLFVNGRRNLDIVMAERLTEEQRAKMTAATNDRFENLVRSSQEAFGALNEQRYDAVVDSFVETVVKAACTVAMDPDDESPSP
jgi:hypothetical protein